MKWSMLTFALVLGFMVGSAPKAHTVIPWAARLNYIKDERTKACFAIYEEGGSFHWGPYFTYVPCELVDKADWIYYKRLAEGNEKDNTSSAR